MPKRSRKQSVVQEKQRKKIASDESLQVDWDQLQDQNHAGLEDQIEDYEAAPRSFGQDSDDEGLPVIKDGKVTKVRRQAPQKESESEEESESEDEPEHEEQQQFTEPSLAELREKIALYASVLNENPEEHISKVKDLTQLAVSTRKAKNRQVLLLSLATIFKDLLPGYRINPLSDAQRQEKASKEVRQLREFEQTLLSQYQKFVQMLSSFFKAGKKGDDNNKYIIACTCITVVCDLLESVPYFNYRDNLIYVLVEKLSMQRIDNSYNAAISCVQSLFEQDNEGNVSLEIVTQLAKMIKRRHYKVDSRVLATLTHLRLLTELVGRADLERMIKEKPEAEHVRKKDRVHLTKRERKQRKEQKQIDEEMRQAETRVSADMREKLQARTLKLVFVLYFNILKNKSKTLTGVTLEGLAKFAHLINSDLFGDLLEVLRQIVNEQDQQNNRESLLCICTAFALLNGQGRKNAESMNLDLTFFVNLFYKTLFQMALDPHIEQSHKHLMSVHRGKLASETDMLMRAFEAIFTKRINVSQQRAMAFSKRLGICALQFPEKTTLIAFNILERIIKRHPQVKALLFTQDRVVKGRYNLEVDVPEYSNPEVSTLWELTVMSRHFNPNVSLKARQLRNLTE